VKTKELIDLLQKCDPSGELEVTVGNTPIYTAETLPAYYDGNLQMLIQDHSLTGYNIVGYKVTGKGYKVSLKEMSLEQIFMDNPTAPVDLSELEGHSKKHWEKLVIEKRQQAVALDEEIAKALAEEKL